MSKPFNLNKLEALRDGLDEAIRAGEFAAARDGAQRTLAALDARIRAVKSTAPSVADHMPRQYVMLPGMSRLGCSCDWYPANPPTRMSQMDRPFRKHRASLNLPTDNWNGSDVLYADGPYKGMTWDQAYRQDGGKQLSAARADSEKSAAV